MAIKTKPPSGMRDFKPDELAKRNYASQIISKVYEKYGFVPIETPSIENLSTLLGKYGNEGDQLLFRILHRRDKLTRAIQNPDVSEKELADMGLRYDLTVPLARFIANGKNLPKFFKRYQIQPVWRADRPGKGRYREFLQCDVDITGTKSIMAEADVCSAVTDVLLELGFKNFKIHINHRQILKAFIEAAGISLNMEATALIAVDKLDKIGEDGVLKELSERGISQDKAKKLLAMIRRSDNFTEEQELERISTILSEVSYTSDALESLKSLLTLLKKTKVKDYYYIDSSLARGLGYYTGSIFEIRSSNFSGSLGGGGRYDGLIGMFRGKEIPAVGFSIGFERLVLLMEEQNLFKEISYGPDLLLCHFADVSDESVISAANKMRDSGLKVEIFPETPKIGKQISYAETVGAKFVGILGSTEANENKISIKNLISGEQKTVRYEDAYKICMV